MLDLGISYDLHLLLLLTVISVAKVFTVSVEPARNCRYKSVRRRLSRQLPYLRSAPLSVLGSEINTALSFNYNDIFQVCNGVKILSAAVNGSVKIILYIFDGLQVIN